MEQNLVQLNRLEPGNPVQPDQLEPGENKENIVENKVAAKPAKPNYDVMKPGDLAWARLGSAPFWPCIITCDLDLKKSTDQASGTAKEYLVQVTKH